MQENVFDVGMFDGADTRYYLDSGYRVIAIEANPAMAEIGRHVFEKELNNGRLIILNIAISDREGSVKLTVCGNDAGASSIFADRIAHRFPLGSYDVPARNIATVIAEYGKPKLIKIDIEGADKTCVQSLTRETAPEYLSFESHDDLPGMIGCVGDLGYQRFKIISQTSFRSLQNQHNLYDRLALRAMAYAGFHDPSRVTRNGRRFLLRHSSGPAPWESDGRWYSAQEAISAWNDAKAAGRISGWYDVHAQRARA